MQSNAYTEMVVVGLVELVLDDDIAPRPSVPCENVCVVWANGDLYALDLKDNADRVAQQAQVLFLCKPGRELCRFVAPKGSVNQGS